MIDFEVNKYGKVRHFAKKCLCQKSREKPCDNRFFCRYDFLTLKNRVFFYLTHLLVLKIFFQENIRKSNFVSKIFSFHKFSESRPGIGLFFLEKSTLSDFQNIRDFIKATI